MPARALSERAARAALAAHFAPGQLAAELDEYTPAEVWDRRVRDDGSGLLASYRPREELAQAELTCSFVIPSDEEWPTALADLGPVCPLGLWIRGRERLPRLTGNAVVVTGNRVPTEQAVTRAHDFATALAEAGHTVTATLAYGVDSTAHQAAAEAGRASLAVLPRGLDGAHPHAHASLLRSVLDDGGAAVSLYRPGTAASGATLKASAVVLAALARAVILVEALDHVEAMYAAETAVDLLRLETDESEHITDRVAGCLALKYGLRTDRLVSLTTDQVLVHPEEPGVVGLQLAQAQRGRPRQLRRQPPQSGTCPDRARIGPNRQLRN
ncbi:DNA-protecting protein DprA [Streptomyces sp. NBC_00445]|uniref:DNA-processing protein DprA n=1 Tax=Streptomyces sp. NBC_00445 TaxID=2975745 RepID=UPI002E242F6C